MPAAKSGRKIVWVVLSVLMLGAALLGGADYCSAQDNNQLQLPDDIKGFIRFKDTAWACANLRLIDNAVMLPDGNSLSDITGNALPENPQLIDSTRKMGVLVLDPKKVGKLAPVVLVPIKNEKDFIRESSSYPLAVAKNNWKVTPIAPTGPGFMLVNEAGFTTYLVVYRPSNTAMFCSDWQILERLFFWLNNKGDQNFFSRKAIVGDVESFMDLQMLYKFKEKEVLDLIKKFNEIPNNPLPMNDNLITPLLKEAVSVESILRFENNAVNYEVHLGLAEGGRIATFAKNTPPADQALLSVMPKRTVRAKYMSLNATSGKMLAEAVESVLDEPELQQIYKPQDLDKIATQVKLMSAGLDGDMLFGACRTEKNDGLQFFAVIKTSHVEKMRPAIKKLASDFLERRQIEPPLLTGAFEPLSADGKIERERLTFKNRFEDDLKEEDKQIRLALMGTLDCSMHFAYPDGAILIAAGMNSENLLKEMIARYQKTDNAGSLADEASFKTALQNLPAGWSGMHYFSPAKMLAGLKTVQANLGDVKFPLGKVMAFTIEKMVGDMPDIVCGMKYEKNVIVIKTKLPMSLLSMLGTARQMFLKKAAPPAPEVKAPAVNPEKEEKAPAPADEDKKKSDDVSATVAPADSETKETKEKAPEKKTDNAPEPLLKGATTFKLNGVAWPIDAILENTAQSKRITGDFVDMPMSEFLKKFTELSGIATDWEGEALTNIAKEGEPEQLAKVAENKHITINADNAPPMAVLIAACRQIGYSFEIFQVTKNDLSYLEVKVPGTFQKYPVKQFAANGPLTCEWYGMMRLASTVFKKDAKEEVRYRYGLGLTHDPNSHVRVNPDNSGNIPVKITFPDGKTIKVEDSKEIFSSSSKNWEIEPKAEWAGKTVTIEVSVPYMAPTKNFSTEVNCAEQAEVEAHDIIVAVNKVERKEAANSFGEKTGGELLKTQIKLVHKFGPGLMKIINEHRQPNKEEEELFQAADPEKAALALVEVVLVGKDGSEIPGRFDSSAGMSGLYYGYNYDLYFELANKEFDPASLKVVWAGSYKKGKVDFKLEKVKLDPAPAEAGIPAAPVQEEMIPENSREPELSK